MVLNWILGEMDIAYAIHQSMKTHIMRALYCRPAQLASMGGHESCKRQGIHYRASLVQRHAVASSGASVAALSSRR